MRARSGPSRRWPLVVYGAALVALTVVGALGARAGWAPERELWWLRGTGWTAAAALLGALSVTPISRLIARVRPGGTSGAPIAPLRRALGITAAGAATLHAALALSTYLGGALGHLIGTTWLRAGAVAWLVLLPLWLTSFPPVVRVLRVRLWKPLHRLAYVAAALAFQHALLSPFAPRRWVLAVFLTAALIGALRLVPRRARPPEPRSGG